jgi:hypothetical protein
MISDFPIVRNVPAVTTEQMREVDCAMVEDYGVTLTRMTEDAPQQRIARSARAD